MTAAGVFAQGKYKMDGCMNGDVRECVRAELGLTKDEYDVQNAYYDIKKIERT